MNENKKKESGDSRRHISRLPLLDCFATEFRFGEVSYEIIYCNSAIKIALDEDNYAVLTLKNQQVPYKATILGGFALSVKKAGNIDYYKYFEIVWPDELSRPEILFFQKPTEIIRHYNKGQRIELGIEEVDEYHVVYQDGVTADFNYVDPGAYEFSFSTGFSGSFKKESDGSHTIRFKGLPIEADEGVYVSESKFIITRSKYTNNLVLVLQDEATVTLTH
jgi:hypothetical protein